MPGWIAVGIAARAGGAGAGRKGGAGRRKALPHAAPGLPPQRKAPRPEPGREENAKGLVYSMSNDCSSTGTMVPVTHIDMEKPVPAHAPSVHCNAEFVPPEPFIHRKAQSAALA